MARLSGRCFYFYLKEKIPWLQKPKRKKLEQKGSKQVIKPGKKSSLVYSQFITILKKLRLKCPITAAPSINYPNR